jgi:hypothetical protein
VLQGGQAGEATARSDDGFAGTPAEVLAIWDFLAEKWHSFGPPWRPSPDDIGLYRTLAGPRLAGRVLLLGVTPELRDAVAAAGGDAVVLDVSGAMHATSTELLHRSEPSHEQWIQKDWCDAPIPTGEFDLVLGDMIWWAEPVRRQHVLRDAIHAALKTDGLLVSRLRTSDPARADEDPVAVFGPYLDAIERAPETEQVVRGAIYAWAQDHTADREHKRFDMPSARAMVLELATTPELSRHEGYLRGLADRLQGPAWTCQSRDELVELLSPRFKVVAVRHAEDYESSASPVVAFEPLG